MSSPSEHWEQSVYFLELRKLFHKWPELGLAYAVPNGGHRYKATAKRLKDEGVKPGVPDICIPVPRGKYHGAYIEMKRRPHQNRSGTWVKEYPSHEQKMFIAGLLAQGYLVSVCEGYSKALIITEQYMSLNEMP